MQDNLQEFSFKILEEIFFISKSFLWYNLRGKIYCLVGKNGRGKTTLLNLIFGIIKPVGGERRVI